MLAPTPGCPNTSRILLIKHDMSTSGKAQQWLDMATL
jgi:hypothetical protein